MSRVYRHILTGVAVLALSKTVPAQDLQSLLHGRGMWLQSPRKFNNTHIQQLKKTGVRRVHVMLTHAPNVYTSCENASLARTTASTIRLTDIVAALAGANMNPIATVYLPPTRHAVDTLTDANGLKDARAVWRKRGGIRFGRRME
jgi:hypothetical protein